MNDVTLTAELEWYGHGIAVIRFKANKSIVKREGIAAFMRKLQQCQLSPEAERRLKERHRLHEVKRMMRRAGIKGNPVMSSLQLRK